MMAKIVYGVSGEGSGHSSRPREMAKHLVEKGHEVKIVSYDHILVYLSFGFDSFLEVMKNLTREKFIVYGYVPPK